MDYQYQNQLQSMASNSLYSSKIGREGGLRPDEAVDCRLMLVYLRRKGHSGKATSKWRGRMVTGTMLSYAEMRSVKSNSRKACAKSSLRCSSQKSPLTAQPHFTSGISVGGATELRRRCRSATRTPVNADPKYSATCWSPEFGRQRSSSLRKVLQRFPAPDA